MTINWNEFITKQYWFGIERGVVHLTDKVILYFGAALVVLGVVFLIVRLLSSDKLKRPQFGRLSSVFMTIGLLEMIWYVLRWQYVSALGSRTTALLIGLAGIYFLIKPLKYFLFQYRKDMNLLNKEQLKEKYLNMKK
ncbi:hypothetical protein IPM19_04325 [bacterium]|nr:MAG: hypothetical protein IPM19_04325 [bacterium]